MSSGDLQWQDGEQPLAKQNDWGKQRKGQW